MMDSRPYRPRGSENLPPVHKKTKSTGTLSNMTSASNAGFRGPAKRAAFGDVTNVVKGLGNTRDEAKSMKIQVWNGSSHSAVPPLVNKENTTHTKDSFSRPAQRMSNFANKPKAVAENRISEPIKKTSRYAQQEPIAHNYLPEDIQNSRVSTVSQTSGDAPALQPRHHKSQPQLKQQQPTLRRTQSKQLEKLPSKSDLNEDSYLPIESEVMTRHEVGYGRADAAYIDSLYLPVEDDHHLGVNHEDDCVDLPSELPKINDEGALVSISYQEAHLPAMSEPEECWEEEDDEEDYDDQDQAYTTAHSFRSRDLTTGGATTVLAPRVTARVQRELEEARIEVENTRTLDEIEEELWDVSMVAEYGDEIFEYMRKLEIKMLPNPHYMEVQTEIQWSMRSVLMDWLVQVHNRFNLLPETLFLAVNYIDRFLSSKIVSIGKLQLVGATAILVASKYEEINCPSLQEIVYMVDHGYTMDEVLKAERFMLSMLSFELGWPGPMSFLRRVSKADDYDLDTRTLAKYFLELTIMDERFVASPPSFLAAGAHCLSRFILNKGDWTRAHVHYSGYTWSQLKGLVTMMLECCEHPTLHHAAVYEKYNEKRFKEVARVVQQALEAGFTLPHHSAPFRCASSHHAHRESTSETQYSNGHLVAIEG